MVRNGMVDAVRRDIVWEERCNMVGQLQYVKVQCGTVFTVRSSKVLYGAMRCGAVSMFRVRCDTARVQYGVVI